MAEQDPFVTQYMEELDERLQPHIDAAHQQIGEIFDDADAKLVALGGLLIPGYRPAALTSANTMTDSEEITEVSSTDKTVEAAPKDEYASGEEALAAGIAHFLDMPAGKSALRAKTFRGASVDHGALARALDNWHYSRGPEEIAAATLEQQRFAEAVEAAKPGTPVFVMTHCAMWTGVVGENPTIATTNRQTTRGESPYLRARGVNVPGYEAWFYGGQQGESRIKHSDEIEFFTQGQVITDDDVDKIPEIISSGSWWGVHDGVQIVGEKAVNTFLERFVKEDFEPVGKTHRGWDKRKKSLVDSTSTLAISLFGEQGYDWLATSPTEGQEHAAQLVDDVFKATIAQLVSGMVVGRTNALFYAPRLGSRAPAWRYEEGDRNEISLTALGVVKEDDVYAKLKGVADMFEGDVEQFVESAVDNFLTNILGLAPEKTTEG